jgi:hypothetical protein
VVAPYFARHIPGQPAIVIKSMLGGSGIRAAGYMTGITPQDGTSLGLFLDTLTLGKVLGGPGEFDPIKLTWIGSRANGSDVEQVSVMVGHGHNRANAVNRMPRFGHVPTAVLDGLLRVLFVNGSGLRGSRRGNRQRKQRS